eukprot:CAMPEP_0174322228 /NCGR_PEP_ID=MMETSP0810-20121108/10877_1 /TAXON_ID=73025 ORGANISM="Eutreptiella gymnastica-like, Strain CCMP1594" /NCGR_SAMPLE_ID=MMETSP0810 /ASSEMBLY_ACC=CAM_ASM_000659 /LENGTH=91 /DNA_ID=CAMNT_0015434005 /DNA_START=1232 /DNA_END=1504 /DNA_ORIENTATION=-
MTLLDAKYLCRSHWWSNGAIVPAEGCSQLLPLVGGTISTLAEGMGAQRAFARSRAQVFKSEKSDTVQKPPNFGKPLKGAGANEPLHQVCLW